MYKKKKDVKSVNIDIEIHKMLKLQALLTGQNMVEIAEKAILESISDEVKILFNSNSETINTILNNSMKKKKVKENKEEIEKIEEETKGLYEEEEEKIFDNINIDKEELIVEDKIEIEDKELECYM